MKSGNNAAYLHKYLNFNYAIHNVISLRDYSAERWLRPENSRFQDVNEGRGVSDEDVSEEISSHRISRNGARYDKMAEIWRHSLLPVLIMKPDKALWNLQDAKTSLRSRIFYFEGSLTLTTAFLLSGL